MQVRRLLTTFEARFARDVEAERCAKEAQAQDEARRQKLAEDAEVLRRMREAMGAPAD